MKVGEQSFNLAQTKGLSHTKPKKEHMVDRLEIGDGGTKIRPISEGMAQKIQFVVTVATNQNCGF